MRAQPAILAVMISGDSQEMGHLVLRRDVSPNGVKIFSATMFADRERLGDKVTGWLEANPKLSVTEFVVTQSSDSAFHCIAITVFYWERLQPS
jgi:hypothetical protein